MPKAVRIKIRNKTGENVWFRVSYPGDLPGLFDYQESVVPGDYDQVTSRFRNFGIQDTKTHTHTHTHNRFLSRYLKAVYDWSG